MTERNIPPQELKSYEDSVNAYRDIVNAIKTAEKKKYAEGRAEGRAEGQAEGQLIAKKEMVKRMATKGLSTETIADLAGLTTSEVEQLITNE